MQIRCSHVEMHTELSSEFRCVSPSRLHTSLRSNVLNGFERTVVVIRHHIKYQYSLS